MTKFVVIMLMIACIISLIAAHIDGNMAIEKCIKDTNNSYETCRLAMR